MEELIIKVKTLKEIELLAFMEALDEHLKKEHLMSLVEQVFDTNRDLDREQELQDEVDELKEEIEELKENIQGAINCLS